MRLARALIGLLAIATTPAVAFASSSPQDVCLNSAIRHKAAELVDAWSQGFAFAKVIIGHDGKFGDVWPPTVEEVGEDYVVCHSEYNLVRPGVSGMAYAVHISDFDFRATGVETNYTISLENLPAHIDGEAEARALLLRFTINQRPYLDILAENQARLAKRAN